MRASDISQIISQDIDITIDQQIKPAINDYPAYDPYAD